MSEAPAGVEEFRASHLAWKAAYDAFQARMLRGIEGETLDRAALDKDIEKMERLRQDFVTKSMPHIHWK